jgi:L-iditol 2-dehydrogenase
MYGLGEARFDDVDEPEVAAGEAIVSVEAAGICGTDLHILSEGVLTDPQRWPVTMGHEFVGRVVAVGGISSSMPESSGIRVGDRVVGEPLLNCGLCVSCRTGFPNLCERWLHLGATRDGAWAEYVSVPVSKLTPMPDHVPTNHAALAEPLACALHFLERAGARIGKSLLIVGGGPAGLMTLLAARAAGIGPIIVSETSAQRRRLAERLGADAVIDPSVDDVRLICRELTAGAGVDVVIELAGAPAAIAGAFHIPRPGGLLLLAGICGEKSISVDTNRIVGDEITVRGAFATRWQMPAAVRLLSSGSLNIDPIVSKTASWLDLPHAMEQAASGDDVCKIVLEF